VKSKANQRFWGLFRALPAEIQEHARDAYRTFSANPRHPSLQFKRVNEEKPMYSVRVTRDYRAVGILKGDTITWFWIGNHADYDRLLTRR
jgi:hypothetical protein